MIIDPRSEIKNIGRGESFKNTLTLLHSRIKTTPTIVEIGTTRGGYGGGPFGDGWATLAWAWYCKKYNGRVYTVDIDKDCIEQCKIITKNYSDVISYNVKTGVDFIGEFPEKIDLLYLDGSDDPNEMVDEYCVATVNGNLKQETLILLDDIPQEYLKFGKGAFVIPMLLEDDWKMVYHDTTQGVMQMLFSREIIK